MQCEKLVDLKDITIRRGTVEVLKDFCWTMYDDQNWFIMGDNGCGKTTLLEIISGYLWPQEGTVRVLGEEYGKTFLPDLRKRIGYVAPWVLDRISGSLTVDDVVASGLEASIGFWGSFTPDILERVRMQFEFFGIPDLSGRHFCSLSTGQKLKVVLARARIGNPRILILDEPFAALDIGTRMKIYTLMDQLAHREHGTRVIMVTHHLEDISEIFTHGMIMKGGNIFKQGRKARILDKFVLTEAFGLF